MTKQDMDGRLTDRKITLPLNQTVFLPKTAMGVRYIDKVRATVFIDKVQRGDGTVWLRGFYELDLEYQGLEGRGLNKYRVMLPLKAELPTEWLGNLQYEAADLHAVVSRPALKILSPYVLEFAGTMRLEYVGEYLWQEDKLDYCPKPTVPRRVWRSDVPMPDADMAELRLESKIDRFFLGRQGDKPMPPRLVTLNEDLPPTEQLPRRRQELPVWPGAGQADDKMQNDKRKNERQGDLVKSGHWVGLDDRNVAQDTHTHQAGDEMTENGGYELPVWQPQMSKTVPKNEEKNEARNEEIRRGDGEKDHKLPVWRFTPKFQTKAEEYAAENMTEKLAENLEETGAEAVPVVEKTVEKPLEKPVEKPVETIVHKKWENYRQTQEQIYAPPLGKNKFRSLLTGAALSRMQARGESLQAEADYAKADNTGWATDLPKMNEKDVSLPKKVAERVAEDVVDAAADAAAKIKTAAADERREDAVTDMSRKLLENVQNEIKADIAAADMTQENEVQVSEVQEIAAENTAEAEIEADEVVAEQTAVAETEAAAESTEEVVAEEAAEVIAEEVGEKAAGTVAEFTADGQSQVAAEVPVEPGIKQGVRMVNNSGVRLRMAAAKQNRPESKTVSAGRSNAPTTPGKGFAMKYYVVKAGDEPMGIALKHNVSLESLLAANRLQNGELPVGTVLRIPV